MPAYVESMAYAGKPCWHGLGQPVSNDMSAEEMLIASGLDWGVEKKPLYFQMEEGGTRMKRAHGQYALVRDSDDRILTITGPNYKPIQNREAMSFFHDFVEAGHMTMETAGSLKGGQYIWALARVNNDFVIGQNDKINNYLLLSSPHKIGHRFVAQYTPVRVCCWNTINLALGSKLKGDGSGFSMTHARRFDDDAKRAAEETLGLVNEQITLFRDVAARLSDVRISDDRMREYFFEVAQAEESEDGEEDDPLIISRFETALLEAPGHDMSPGTLWSAFNAVTFTVDHVMGRERDTALASAWFSTGSVTKRRALDTALAYAKAA